MSDTFRAWLGWQEFRDDPIGDLARDVSVDPCASGISTAAELLAHIVTVHGCEDSARAAFSDAFTEWDKARWEQFYADAWTELWAA